MKYYTVPGSVYALIYGDAAPAKAPPANAWLSVTYSGRYYERGTSITADNCSCLANVDGNGTWHYVAHIGANNMPDALDHTEDAAPYTWRPGMVLPVRLWRLAKDTEIP